MKVPTVFGKKKPANQDQVAQMINLLRRAAETPDRTEQNGPIAEADALYMNSEITKATGKAFIAASPNTYLTIEATHMSWVTGETVYSAKNRLNEFLRTAGNRAYRVFFWPRPEYVISELRTAGDYLISEYVPEGNDGL